ncbi:MAG: hypothetical protein QOG69_874 [Actinomycetota bacterium]|nr:hypothetical protein [Actinomycetota bacterium]
MLASVRSATLLGIAGQPVQVEVHVSNGLPAFMKKYTRDRTRTERQIRARSDGIEHGALRTVPEQL